MRGRGAFQIAQMRHRDPRIIELCDHLRAAVDLLERLATEFAEPEPSSSPLPIKNAPAVQLVESERLALSVKEASRLLGLGRNSVYEAVNEGKIPAVKFGKRTLIPAKGLRDWLDALPRR